MIKKFDEYNKRIKDITSIDGIDDIVELFKNEIEISESDPLIEYLYTSLLNDCFLQKSGFINMDIIGQIRSNIHKSETKIGAKKQYKSLVNPHSDFSATLLKILTEYPKINLTNPQISFIDALTIVSRYILTGKCVSENQLKTILRSKI